MKRNKNKEEKTRSGSAYDRMWMSWVDAYRRRPALFDRWIVVTLFVILFGVRLHNLSIKTELHSDEVFSLMISTCNPYYSSEIPDGEYSGANLKRMIASSADDGVSGAMKDIAQLWHNNGDTPHASLYYMVLRVALIGLDSFDIHSFVMRGGVVNLLFFAVSFFFMYKLLRRIFGSRSLLVFAGLAMAMGNWMSIRNTLLMREYQMAETGIIVLTLIGVTLIAKLRNREPICRRKFLIGFSLVVAYVISLGYFNAIYVLLFGVGVMAACWHYGDKKSVLMIVAAGMIAVVVAWLLYPGFFNFLIHESVHREKAFELERTSNLFRYVFMRDLMMQFFTVYGTVIMLSLFVIVLASPNRRQLFHSCNFAWIPVIVLVCMMVIQYASILKMPRYYYPLMPVFALIVPHVMSAVPKSWTGYFEVLVLLYMPSVVVLFPVHENYGWKPLGKALDRAETSFYKLNPNEIVQLVPAMDDERVYSIRNHNQLDLSRDSSFVVTKADVALSPDSFAVEKKTLGGKHIFMYKSKYKGNNPG